MSSECAYRGFGEGDWHAHWKSLAPPDRREVTIDGMRADMASADGFVVEVQSSKIAASDIAAREFHYQTMAWVVDYTSRAGAFVDGTRFRRRYAKEIAWDEEAYKDIRALDTQVDALRRSRDTLTDEQSRVLAKKSERLLSMRGYKPKTPSVVFQPKHGWDSKTRVAPWGYAELPKGRGAWGRVAKAPVFFDMGASNGAVLRLDPASGVKNGQVRAFAVNRSWLQVAIAYVMHGKVRPPRVLVDRDWDGRMPKGYSPAFQPAAAPEREEVA